MFWKSSKKLETIIGEDSEFKGELTVKDTIRVDGVLEGDIRADWVIVGETGKILGNIDVRGMVVGGRIEGNICAAEIVELKHRSHVLGEIRSGRLAISEGAVFVGYSIVKDGKESDRSQEEKVVKLSS